MYAWCPTCERNREIVEESDESDYTGPRTETIYRAARLSCGHTLQHDVGTKPTGF